MAVVTSTKVFLPSYLPYSTDMQFFADAVGLSNSNDGNFEFANNWYRLPIRDSQGLPGQADTAVIAGSPLSLFGSLTVDTILIVDSDKWYPLYIPNNLPHPNTYVSHPGATAVFDDATLTTNRFFVASSSYDPNPSPLHVNSRTIYGGNNSAILQNGTQLTTGLIEVGGSVGDVGTLTVTGLNTAITGSPTINVGISGSGTLKIEDGANVEASSVNISSASGAFGHLILDGAALTADTINVFANGTIEGGGSIHGNLVNSGQVHVSGVSLEITGDISGLGSLLLDGGANLTINGKVTSTITAGGGSDSLTINGSGTSTVDTGVGTYALSISGGGTLIVNGNLVGGTSTIAANSTLELKGTDSGKIIFSDIGGTLQIDGTTMPTGVISGFDSDDAIDLRGVTFDAHSATVLQTSNNSVQLNNVLHVFANGQDYKLQLDPNQKITGGFQLYPDGSGGTKISLIGSPVTGGQTTPFYSTSVYPYMAVVDIETATGHGTGFIIGPHSILTAAHVIENSSGQIFSGIKIYPGSGGTNQPTGSPITVNTANVHPGDYAAHASSTDPANQYDWAVLNVSADLSAYGSFQIMPDYSGGIVNITGYPGFPQTSGILSIASVAAPDGFGEVFAENPTITVKGYSGGPLWVYDGSVARAVGIVSGAFDVRITSDDWDDIQSFMKLPVVTGEISGKLVHGYISGATVFSDDNKNGQFDPTESTTTTDATGSFSLLGGTGPLIALGGIDTSTGLAFKGQLSAPEGSSIVTPLTTFLTELSADPQAQQKVLASFGLSSSLDLTTFDPIAAARAGSVDGAAVEVAHAKVYDTVSLIASALVGAGGDFSSAAEDTFAAIAAAIGGSGISPTDQAEISALITQIAQSEGLVLGLGVADSVAGIIVASNALLDQKAQGGATGDALLNDIAAIERVIQGTASNAIQQAGNDPAQLQALVDVFTGTKLDDAVSTALSHLGSNEDTTAPTLTPVSDQTLEAINAAGAATFFAATATDLVDGADPVVFKEGNTVVHSGDIFSLGTHTITASTIDAAGNTASEAFNINVVDTTAPTLTPVADQTKEATSAAGAAAFFAATATDLVDGTDPVVFKEGNTVVHSGDIFSLGNHTIAATTIDAAGNVASETFTINVQDTTAPTLTPIADQTVQATTNAGAAAFFAATATDLVDGTDPVVFKEGNTVIHSGDIFGLGSHTITASTIDAAGNSASETFSININVALDTNHDPIAVADSNGVAKGKTVSVSASKGVLANDSDSDHDHLSVWSVNGSAANVGHSIKGEYGTLTLNADGSYSYAATTKASPSQIFAEDTFAYTTVDGHGGSDTSTLTFAVFDPSATYKAGSNTILFGGNGKNVLDGSAGHDLMYGGNGADVLIGGKGDILAGGRGPDQFVFRPDFGVNTILDFDVNNDHLQFDNSIFESVKSIIDHTSNTPLGALISDGHGDSVLLLGVNKSQLVAHSSDLLIA